LPAGDQPVPIPAEWTFSAARPLPAGFINNAFEGWDRGARVEWPARGLTLAITAAAPLSRYMVYSPAATSDFFCFEPVSHPVDAFHLPGGPMRHGMVRLAPGEVLSGTVTFAARTGR
jgi:aldose 1-epimerase